ncbi:alpha/beta hydrolase [Solirubrobacter sp. CPCC 204708]|uniref:GPI inositol-deacylase PGAP1-like alpha/beta domain-containing protein n=1 Tax=Solirubrobacter deserti TaxID=2282478 RepID=A0ABT4RF44_9ACTN|nr:hypothetical protein [Solirubrobacter deserti]MBE2318655.1 alpha/beta hydrolase [Solirubrobacter deserti]MDA0137113.1 hypothetical protein [Solirubrobacter deserti]
MPRTALGRLAGTELAGLSRGIGDVHFAISGRVFRTVGPAALPVRALHDAIARGTYAAVAGGLRSAALLPLNARPEVLGALNGLIGDELHASGSPLAIEMTAARISEPRLPAVLVWVHGLGETEHAWGHPHLPGWTSVHVRYNTGRSIAENGAELARLIEALDWDIERVALVGHSMGGLVARSACACDAPWTARVSHTISLGTPHDGAPLAQLVHHLESVLRSAPETRPFAQFLGRRSAGIRDLRRGVRDPLLTTARHGFISATVTRDARHLAGRVLGDTLVLSASASGEGDLFALGGTHHLALLNHPKVYEQLEAWLA